MLRSQGSLAVLPDQTGWSVVAPERGIRFCKQTRIYLSLMHEMYPYKDKTRYGIREIIKGDKSIDFRYSQMNKLRRVIAANCWNALLIEWVLRDLFSLFVLQW